MTVKDLEKLLSNIKDKDMPIRALRKGEEDLENHWVNEIEVSEKSKDLSYPNGELRLITSE